MKKHTLITILAVLATASTFAQTLPDRVVRIIAAGPPGGSLDFVSRLLADGLQKEMNKAFLRILIDRLTWANNRLSAA